MVYLFVGLNRTTNNGNHEPLVSIIVVAKNEQENVLECLNALDQQNYPKEKYEIIFVDDNSADSTLDIVKQNTFQTEAKILKGQNKFGWKSSKKACLELARQEAIGEIFLFTDVDCRPGLDWIKAMVSAFSERTGLVAGYSPQITNGKKLWNGFLVTDSLAAATVSAGGIGWGHGITCTGRNLAVRAATLNEIGGYSSTKDSLSGDDDFLLQAVAAHPSWDVSYVKDAQSVVPSIGPSNFLSFIRQKQRHISAGKKYDLKSQFGYLLYHGANFILWLNLFFRPLEGIVPLIFKIAADAFLISHFSRKVGKNVNILSLFLWEILFPVYHVISSPVAFWGKVKWR